MTVSIIYYVGSQVSSTMERSSTNDGYPYHLLVGNPQFQKKSKVSFVLFPPPLLLSDSHLELSLGD